MAEYLDSTQRQVVERLMKTPMARTEWPTWVMMFLVYGSWGASLYWSADLGRFATTVLLIVSCAWFMSFQHEVVHGHPTRNRWFNKTLAYAPLAVWFPYTLYTETHLRHHNDAHLTLPGVDPETHYVSQRTWERSGWFMRALYWQRKQFWGRFMVGPAMSIVGVAREALGQIRRGNYRYVPMWATHISLVIVMLAAVQRWAGIGPLYYLFLVSYPAMSLAMVRSYYEHRAADDCKHRIVINEASWPMRLLFLNNNFHLVHHDMPALPWYLLPRVYWANREAYLKRCGGFRIDGYGELIRRFSFKPVDAPLHPLAQLSEERRQRT